MYAEAVLFVAGLAALLYGAEKLVDNASKLALYYGVSAFFIGVTVVSVGTSVPEMATSVFSALYGAGDIVVGNIVGSETAQITLAIGIVALISPIVAKRRNVMVYGGGMVLAMIIMLLTLEDGILIRSEGFLMMLAYVFFVYHMYTTEGGEEVVEDVDEAAKPEKAVPWIIAGIVLVVAGGHLMVQNGVAIAAALGVPQYLIGLLTGLGTTLPEIAVAGIAARNGDAGISVGALLGSNITDPVFSLGLGGLVAEVAITQNPSSLIPGMASIEVSMWYMLLVSVFVISLMYWREGIDRKTGILCILLYLPAFILL